MSAEEERDPSERAVLDAARAALQPSARDAARVLAKTQRALAAGAGAIAGEGTASAAHVHAGAGARGGAWHARCTHHLTMPSEANN